MNWLSNHRWAVLGFMAGAAYWPTLLEGAFVPRWAAIAVGLPLVSKLDPRSLPETMLLLLGFLLFICGLSLLQSPFFLVGMGDFVFVTILSLAFIAGAGLASMDDVMLGAGAGLALSSGLVTLQYFGIWNPVFDGSITPAGLFYNSEIMGEFAALVLVWGAVRATRSGEWLPGLIALIASVALVLSFSRIGYGAAAIGLLVGWRPRARTLALVLAACLVAGVGFLLFTKFSSSFHRVILWGATLMSFTPLGRGLGWAALAFPEEEFCHSDALQALTELGIGGVGLLLIPVAAFRSKRGTHADYALFAAVLVEVAVSFPLHFPASGFLAAVVAGFLVGTGPVLRGVASGSDQGDEPRRFRWRDAAHRNALRGKSFGLPISVRSVFTKPAPLRARSALSTGSA